MKINLSIEKAVAENGKVTYHVTAPLRGKKVLSVVEEIGGEAEKLYLMIARHMGDEKPNG